MTLPRFVRAFLVPAIELARSQNIAVETNYLQDSDLERVPRALGLLIGSNVDMAMDRAA